MSMTRKFQILLQLLLELVHGCVYISLHSVGDVLTNIYNPELPMCWVFPQNNCTN